MMDKDTEVKWGNSIGFVLLPFKISLRDDPLDYIREAKATIDRKKNSLEAIYTFSISELALRFFGIKVINSISQPIVDHFLILDLHIRSLLSECPLLQDLTPFYTVGKN